MARSTTDGEDIAQEVFLIAYRRRLDLPGLRNPASWLYRIVENVTRHLWRRRRRQRVVRFGVERLTEVPDARPTPLDVLEQRRLLAHLERALSTLREGDRRLLLQKETRSGAARLTRVAINAQTVRVRRHRARIKIARCLRELEVAQGC